MWCSLGSLINMLLCPFSFLFSPCFLLFSLLPGSNFNNPINSLSLDPGKKFPLCWWFNVELPPWNFPWFKPNSLYVILVTSMRKLRRSSLLTLLSLALLVSRYPSSSLELYVKVPPWLVLVLFVFLFYLSSLESFS